MGFDEIYNLCVQYHDMSVAYQTNQARNRPALAAVNAAQRDHQKAIIEKLEVAQLNLVNYQQKSIIRQLAEEGKHDAVLLLANINGVNPCSALLHYATTENNQLVEAIWNLYKGNSQLAFRDLMNTLPQTAVLQAIVRGYTMAHNNEYADRYRALLPAPAPELRSSSLNSTSSSSSPVQVVPPTSSEPTRDIPHANVIPPTVPEAPALTPVVPVNSTLPAHQNVIPSVSREDEPDEEPIVAESNSCCSAGFWLQAVGAMTAIGGAAAIIALVALNLVTFGTAAIATASVLVGLSLFAYGTLSTGTNQSPAPISLSRERSVSI